jgi:glycosyltransferase involved in cell wall biosynthesis
MSDAVPTLFTILLPITRPPVMLPLAIESVLAQSVIEFELFIICDGAPAETVACARDFARRDTRVKVFPFPKGQRHGEAHRHTVLEGAAGHYVAQIADDDLWFPDHLAELEILLSKSDFGNLLHVFLHPDGRVEILPSDIGLPETRQRMLTEKFNLFGPTVAGYRLEAYRRLPEGWAPAPNDVWSDLHMWRKFLRMESFVFATRATVTGLVFATPQRIDVTLEQRKDENRIYFERIRDPHGRNEIVQTAWHSLLNRELESERQVLELGAARDNLVAALARTTELVAAKDEEINRTHQSNGELVAALARATELVAAKDEEINRILHSRSWRRLTAPMRKSFAIARRLRGAHPTRHGG